MNYILEAEGITKDFPGVRALDNVCFKVFKGEIHALVGENGAGKSTLIKILSGVYPSYSYEGKIFINGEEKKFNNVRDSEEAGISVIYQELTLIKELSIAENIFLGNEPLKIKSFIDWDKICYNSAELLKRVKLDINVNRKVKELGVGQQQLVEIVKALSKNANILILDEPTASLSETETENLMEILRSLKKEGVTCIYISHRLKEIFEIADRVTVLRDGRTIGTEEMKDLKENRVISMMVGRELKELYPKEKHVAKDVVLEVKNFCVANPSKAGEFILNNISFKVREGEILGIAGLVGSGRTELVSSIFGAYNATKKGEIFLNGQKIEINSPADAIKHGIGLLTEDRKIYGLVLKMDVKKNITLSAMKKVSKILINENEEIKYGKKFVEELKIKTPSLETLVNNLSGGNQQKVVLAKWLLTEPKILFLDEPTRGIDVGAKVEIYKIMNDLIKKGVCIVMISSELPEIIGMSDRILVMSEGKISCELQGGKVTQEEIMYYATGGK